MYRQFGDRGRGTAPMSKSRVIPPALPAAKDKHEHPEHVERDGGRPPCRR